MRCEGREWHGDHSEQCQREGQAGDDGHAQVLCRWHRAGETRRLNEHAAWIARRDADTAIAEAIEARCEALAARLGTRVDPMYLELRGSGVRGYSDVSALVPLVWLEQLADATEVGWARLRGYKSPRGRTVERGELVLPPVE